MGSNSSFPGSCHSKRHAIPELSGGRENDMRITQKTVLEKLLELHREKKRPIHIGDLKEAFNVVEKRDVVRSHGWRKTDKIEYALRELFMRGSTFMKTNWSFVIMIIWARIASSFSLERS